MKTISLTATEMYKFMSSHNEPNSFATICLTDNQDTIVSTLDGLHICCQTYTESETTKILNQACDWELFVVHTEEWDPSFMPPHKKKSSKSALSINAKNILVKDKRFAGLISYGSDVNGYHISYVLTDEFDGEPVLFYKNEGFGSSDKDMFYVDTYYLSKKSI